MVCPGPVTSKIFERAFTGEPGRVQGGRLNLKLKFMSAERCAKLMAIAMANKLPEVWIVMPIFLPFSYLNQYMPSFSRWLYCLVMNERQMQMMVRKDS